MTFAVVASPLAPIPPRYTMASDMSRTLPFDFTPLLNVGGGETVVSATSSLTDKSVARGEAIAIANPTLASPIVNQALPGSKLVIGHVHWLRITATTSTGNVWTQILTILCPA